MNWLRLVLLVSLCLSSCLAAAAQNALKYRYPYVCNKEKIVVDHCRSDSDTLGMPLTKPSDDYCQLYYPDRPESGGFQAMGTSLRSEVIQTLSKCGALKPTSSSSETAPAALTSAPVTAQDFYDLGEEQYKANNYADAAESFKKVIAMDPAASPWVNLGNCYASLGRYPEAIDAEKQALKLKPDNPVAIFNVGMYYVDSQKFEDGVTWLVEYRKLEPKVVSAASKLGYAYFSLRKYPEAISQFEDAVRLDPKNANEHFNLAIAYYSSGQKDRAMEQYAILKSLDPDRAARLLTEITGGK